MMGKIKEFFIIAVIGVLLAGCGSKSSQSMFKKGVAAFAKRDYSSAIEKLSAASSEITGSTDLYYTLGLAYLHLGDMDKALAAFKKTLDLDASHYESIICLGQIAYHKTDLATSRACYQAALKLIDDDHKKAVLYTSMALVESGLKNEGLARLYLIRAVSCDRGYAPALYNLGTLYRDKFGFKEEALDYFKKYLKVAAKKEPHYAKAENHIERLTQNIARLESSRQAGMTRDAVTASEHLGNGVVFQSEKKYREAIKSYNAALKADPLAFSAAYGKAMAYQRLNSPREAFPAFQEALEINPDHQDSYSRAITLAMELRRYSDAGQLLDRAIARNAAYSSYYDLMTRVLYSQNRYAEAQKYGEYYLTLLEPNDKDRAAYERWVNSLSQ
ncbi:MAG: tetratricopeptide repeat protein [Kiritimatiellae bacterium]|nr:tetratricopeptide repeat protein [Kiritimatiellia bacterium]